MQKAVIQAVIRLGKRCSEHFPINHSSFEDIFHPPEIEMLVLTLANGFDLVDTLNANEQTPLQLAGKALVIQKRDKKTFSRFSGSLVSALVCNLATENCIYTYFFILLNTTQEHSEVVKNNFFVLGA